MTDADLPPAGRPELVIGLVTPVGTRTSDLADAVRTCLTFYGYQSEAIHLSEHLPGPPGPGGELYDARVRRLMEAGNKLCALNDRGDQEGGRAAIARLAILSILRTRAQLHRQDGLRDPIAQLVARPRPGTAYILHSLKRPHEIQLLRSVYGGQFLLLGSQDSHEGRLRELLSRPLSGSDDGARRGTAELLMRIDADDTKSHGQRINNVYPMADYFLSSTNPRRFFDVLFGQPIAPEIDEYAMYAAEGAFGRSLAASRKVGAALVRGDALIATGYNDVPTGQQPDVLEGHDTSELFKRENVRDTMQRLSTAGLLAPGVDVESALDEAVGALKGGQLLGVIEYQRAVHAEARCLDDALTRGLSSVGARLFVTTYPCHLCYKHILSARVAEVRYIEPYPKSRAESMYSRDSEKTLKPYEGTAPGRYGQLFMRRPAFVSDVGGMFITPSPRQAAPRIEGVHSDQRRSWLERSAVKMLKLK